MNANQGCMMKIFFFIWGAFLWNWAWSRLRQIWTEAHAGHVGALSGIFFEKQNCVDKMLELNVARLSLPGIAFPGGVPWTVWTAMVRSIISENVASPRDFPLDVSGRLFGNMFDGHIFLTARCFEDFGNFWVCNCFPSVLGVSRKNVAWGPNMRAFAEYQRIITIN